MVLWGWDLGGLALDLLGTVKRNVSVASVVGCHRGIDIGHVPGRHRRVDKWVFYWAESAMPSVGMISVMGMEAPILAWSVTWSSLCALS